ncbi:MAG: class I SAM-dependent methyltransferase [Actinomycetota bacterium]|nr:class I SAM-dependent methyltransferase [Actinomycetota bacterium]
MISETLGKLRMPPDTFERHRLIADLCGAPESVLDVGGIRGELGLFLPESSIVTINMAGEDSDAVFDGDALPFPDDSFEVAVSLDVLEHIPGAGRQKHFSELCRVASRKVVICCPFGSAPHIAAERELATWYEQTTGEQHRFLEEHLETGLPSEAELNDLAEGTGMPHRLRFHGDFRRANRAFKSSTRLRAKPGPATAFRYARLRLDPRRSLALDDESSAHANRAFVELETVSGPGAGT